MEFIATIEGFDELMKALDVKTINKILNKTANDEGRRFKTYVAKRVRQEYNIKSSEIKSVINVKKAGGNNNSFVMSISSPRIPLSHFTTKIKTKKVPINRKGKRYRAKRKIVMAKVKRGRAKVVKGAFMIHDDLYKRIGEARMPIKKLSTLSVADMFNKDIVEDGFRLVEEKYPSTLMRHYRFYTS